MKKITLNTKALLHIAQCAVCILLLMACQQQEGPQLGNSIDSNLVRITAQVDVTQTRAESPYAGNDLSLSIDYGTGDKYTLHNNKWTKTTGSTTWSTAAPMLWKDVTTTAKIYAYAPFAELTGSSAITAVPFSVAADQSGGLTSSDLLGYSNNNCTPGSSLNGNNELNILFTHKLAKLNIALNFGDQFGGSSPAITSVSIGGTLPSTSYDATTETIGSASGTATGIKTYNNSGVYEAIIIPQTVAKDTRLVTISLDNGDNYYYTISTTEGYTFAGNWEYTINLRIGKDKIVLDGEVTVGSWDTDDNDPFAGGGEATSIDIWDGTIATSFADGDGTEANPYQIETGAQLAYLASLVNESDPANDYSAVFYKITGAIDLNTKEWTAIGTYSDSGNKPFNGTLDGNDQKIIGLSINNTAQGSQGLFGHLGSSGKIMDLDVSGSITTATTYTGGLVGYNLGNIEGCKFTGSILNSGLAAGGIAGETGSPNTDGNSGPSIKNCHNAGSITATNPANTRVGGIVGLCRSLIEGCANGGDILAKDAKGSNANNRAGGISGYNEGSIISCYNTGGITSRNGTGNYSGGISGTINKDSKMSACYNAGAILAEEGSEDYAGGLAANSNKGSGKVGPTVTSCYNVGTVTATKYGGLFQGSNGGSISYCYCLNSVTIENKTGSIVTNVATLSDGQMRGNEEVTTGNSILSLLNTDFTTPLPWIQKNDSYPQLSYENQ